MNTPEQPNVEISTAVSPSQAGTRLLSRYADTDSLFVRPTSVAPAEPKSASIPLVRFQQLEQEIRYAPANAGPYIELSKIYLSQSRWTDARRVLDAGVQNCPECEELILMHEDLLLHQSGLLIESAKLNLAQNPNDTARYELEQAEISYANERIRVCRERYARHPEQKDILITWAIALRQMSRHEEAIEVLNTAASEPAIRARASLQLGMCYQTLNRPLEALSALRRSALFRAPPPEHKIRQRALELAVAIAEENGLIDSARFYAKALVDSCDPSERAEHQRKLSQLNALDL